MPSQTLWGSQKFITEICLSLLLTKLSRGFQAFGRSDLSKTDSQIHALIAVSQFGYTIISSIDRNQFTENFFRIAYMQCIMLFLRVLAVELTRYLTTAILNRVLVGIFARSLDMVWDETLLLETWYSRVRGLVGSFLEFQIFKFLLYSL